eukprot:1140862-Pelagomonas_calceolata.AAC.2
MPVSLHPSPPPPTAEPASPVEQQGTESGSGSEGRLVRLAVCVQMQNAAGCEGSAEQEQSTRCKRETVHAPWARMA